jgi:hypothetical protein
VYCFLDMQVPKPDIVITSYEAAAADAPALKAIAWEVVLLDERQRGRAGLAKVRLCNPVLCGPDLCSSSRLMCELLTVELLGRTSQTSCTFTLQVHSMLGDLDAAFRMLIAGSRAQASSSDAAAMEFLQPPHIDLEALAQNRPKGSPEAAAQASQSSGHSAC